MSDEYGSIYSLPTPTAQMLGIRIGRRARPKTVVAYADDVIIFISSVTEFPIIEEALQLFEKASGASINPRKSKALAVGRWRAQETIRGIQYHPSVTILGITFWATIDQTTRDTWARITGKVRMRAKKAYDGDTYLARRIQYVHYCLLAKLWSTAQILPLARPYTQQLTTALTWYIWKGAVFRVKLSTLQRPKRMGRMGLIDIAAKCRALFLCQMYLQGHNDRTITAAWMRYWNLTGRQENPPQAMQIPGKFAPLHCYAIDMAYIQHTDRPEAPSIMGKRTYNTLREMALAVNGDSGVRIMTMHPTEPWDTVWENLHDIWTPVEVQSTWFQVIHDLIPTNARLARIRLRDTDKCPLCGRTDTLLHRLTERNDMADIWACTRARIAMMLRTAPRHIPPEWTLHPVFHIWPPQRRGAILWLLAQMVYFCIQNRQLLTRTDYADFLGRARWKAHQKARRWERIGNYLVLL
jgi:hypothetical protein